VGRNSDRASETTATRTPRRRSGHTGPGPGWVLNHRRGSGYAVLRVVGPASGRADEPMPGVYRCRVSLKLTRVGGRSASHCTIVIAQFAWLRPIQRHTEPTDHEVVRDQQLVAVVLADDREVFDRGTQSHSVLIALVVRHAVQPGEAPVRVSATVVRGGHRRTVGHEVTGVCGHVWQMPGDDVGGLGRSGDRAVVDRREGTVRAIDADVRISVRR
jgi:hypothetical protein